MNAVFKQTPLFALIALIAPPAGGPINFLVYPYLESEGRELTAKTQFEFKRIP